MKTHTQTHTHTHTHTHTCLRRPSSATHLVYLLCQCLISLILSCLYHLHLACAFSLLGRLQGCAGYVRSSIIKSNRPHLLYSSFPMLDRRDAGRCDTCACQSTGLSGHLSGSSGHLDTRRRSIPRQRNPRPGLMQQNARGDGRAGSGPCYLGIVRSRYFQQRRNHQCFQQH